MTGRSVYFKFFNRCLCHGLYVLVAADDDDDPFDRPLRHLLRRARRPAKLPYYPRPLPALPVPLRQTSEPIPRRHLRRVVARDNRRVHLFQPSCARATRAPAEPERRTRHAPQRCAQSVHALRVRRTPATTRVRGDVRGVCGRWVHPTPDGPGRRGAHTGAQNPGATTTRSRSRCEFFYVSFFYSFFLA